jgi:hypothetical protein
MPAVFVRHDDADRARAPQHVVQLPLLIGRIGGGEHEAGHSGAHLQEDPIGRVRRHDEQPLARLEALEQAARDTLGIREKLRVRPASTPLAIGMPVHERDGVRRVERGRPQKVADRDVEYRLRPVGGPV